MKKRNIIAILASCAAVISIFTACGNKEEGVTNPTVVGTDGKVYEEITEAVTDAEGEAVTDAQGETQVVVVTKPYTTKEAEKEKDKDKDKGKEKEEDNTQAPEENPATPGASDTTAAPGAADTTAPLFPFMTEPVGETTTTYEDVTLPEGEIIDIGGSSGGYTQTKKDKLFNSAFSQGNSLYLDCVPVIDGEEFFKFTSVKIYMKDNKMAYEMPLGVTTVRMAFDGKSSNIIFPATKYYFPMGEVGENDVVMTEEMNILTQALFAEGYKYVKTERVKYGNTQLLCETYESEDGSAEMKYAFNGKDELKRIEMKSKESNDNSSIILNINDISAKVDDSIFSVPKGYTQISAETAQKILGTQG